MTAPFDIREADALHIWHPYTQHATSGSPRPIRRAEGTCLFDDQGNAILDMISSWWVTLHGHAHPRIAQAIADQARTLEQVIFAGFTHEPAARLASRLVKVAPPGLARVFYSDNGSTAVEVAVKMALQFWRNSGSPRTKIVAMEHAYHGDTFGAMSVSARGLFTAPFEPHLFDVIRLPDAETDDAVAAFGTLLAERGDEVAAIIVEPMLQGAGGMRMWSADALRSLRELASRHGIPFIADEVLTGFGRTGPLFACEHAGIAPDIMCLSKGITAGFLPMGATLATEQIFERFLASDVSRTFFHGHSYTANPLACAAAVASLDLLDDQCAARRRNIELCNRQAAERFAAHERVANARVLGTVLAFEVDAGADYTNPVGRSLHEFALARGVLLRPLGSTVYFLPPFCASTAELESAYAVVADFLAAS